MSKDITQDEQEAIDEFLDGYFASSTNKSLGEFQDEEKGDFSVDEAEDIEKIVELSRNVYNDRGSGYLGLALSFILSAEGLSKVDKWVADPKANLNWEDDILPRYDQKGVDYRTGQNIDTLTLRRGDVEEGLRSRINEIGDFFQSEMSRTNFPNAPGHYTGNWEDHVNILELAFSLSSSGRHEAAERLIEFGLIDLESKNYPTREPPFPQPFLEVLNDYERTHDNEMGGLTYQAMIYGYVKTEWPHLSLRASSVRTGSSRQHRFGDIDGYQGPDLMVSVEVKDRDIDEDNVHSELGTMMKVAERSTALSVAICRQVSEDARTTLEEEDVKVMTDEDLRTQLNTWDYHKQNLALQGMVHFLEHVEENPTATERLLEFIEGVDPDNTALAHLKTDS